MSPNQNLHRAPSDRYLWLWAFPGIAFLAGLFYLLWKKRIEQGNIQPVRIDLSFVRQSVAGSPGVSSVTEIPTPFRVEEPVPSVVEPVAAPSQAKELAPVDPPPSLSETPVVAPQPDDLVVLIGIGPKVANVLRASGIDTFARLAQSDPLDLRKILDAAGLRLPDPTTWPEQARLAAEGRWQEMKEVVTRHRTSNNA
jgi:predicted flap endonuclease-1-like 5' DNA nuclease